MTRFEVWGDPIDHSLSPRLHTAAYAALGWDRDYGRRQVDEESFAAQLGSLASDIGGLSLTFPLKGVAFAAATWRDAAAELTGAVNTLVPTATGGFDGYNTDVGGIVADLRTQGIDGISRARIVGAGATATSALVALHELGAEDVDLFARRPEAVAPLAAVGEQLGVRVSARPLDAQASDAPEPVQVTIATVPGGAAVPPEATRRLAETGGLLYDVVYGHWPTALAEAWQAEGGPAVNGLGMLVQQAVRQIRIFRTGDPHTPLPREDVIVDVMRSALMGD